MLASVTDGRYPTNRPDQIPEWFSNRGYTITVSVEDGTFWATLASRVRCHHATAAVGLRSKP
jgi:hypothetical protein